MCEHCGCRGIDPIAELMDEHYDLLEDGHSLRHALAAGDKPAAAEILDRLTRHLDVHVRREERGIFAALRQSGEFVGEVEDLEREHEAFDAAVESLDPDGPDFQRRVTDLLRDLEEHVQRENLGIFPVSVVTLGADGWQLVGDAREAFPTFLSRGRCEGHAHAHSHAH